MPLIQVSAGVVAHPLTVFDLATNMIGRPNCPMQVLTLVEWLRHPMVRVGYLMRGINQPMIVVDFQIVERVGLAYLVSPGTVVIASH